MPPHAVAAGSRMMASRALARRARRRRRCGSEADHSSAVRHHRARAVASLRRRHSPPISPPRPPRHPAPRPSQRPAAALQLQVVAPSVRDGSGGWGRRSWWWRDGAPRRVMGNRGEWWWDGARRARRAFVCALPRPHRARRTPPALESPIITPSWSGHVPGPAASCAPRTATCAQPAWWPGRVIPVAWLVAWCAAAARAPWQGTRNKRRTVHTRK